MVPPAGIEPARPCRRQILSLLCLPISPQRQLYPVQLHYVRQYTLYLILQNLVGLTGLEPVT